MTYLSLLSDVLLIAATGGMALWCRLLARRLRDLDNAEARDDGTSDVEARIAALAKQIEDLKIAAATTRFEIDERGERMKDQLGQADDMIGRMEMLLATYEDIETQTEGLMREPAPAEVPAMAEESGAAEVPAAAEAPASVEEPVPAKAPASALEAAWSEGFASARAPAPAEEPAVPQMPSFRARKTGTA